MKNFSFLLALLALVLVLGLAFVGCSNSPNEDPKSIRITGVTGSDIPTDYSMIRIRVFSGTIENSTAVAGQGGVQIRDQTIQTPLVIVVNGGTTSTGPAWTGNGDHFIALYFVKSDSSIAATFLYTNGAALNSNADVVKYNFTKAESVIEFSKFKKVP
jgi:hypothetical protein